MDKLNIGILFCSYGKDTQNYIRHCISPWESTDLLCNVSFAATSAQFSKFETEEDYESKRIFEANGVERVFHSINPISEAEARSGGLNLLSLDSLDYVWLVDSDEIYKTEEINAIVNFLERNRLTNWFSISLKNFVFDKSTYLEEPFQPPRIFKTHCGDVKLAGFYWDNEPYYIKDENNSQHIDFKSFSSIIIPPNVAWISHYSWLNDERSRKKIEYQKARGWNCSYDWNKETGLTFSIDCYKNSKHFPNTLKAVQ